jgi:hypothetical protein
MNRLDFQLRQIEIQDLTAQLRATWFCKWLIFAKMREHFQRQPLCAGLMIVLRAHCRK